MSGGHQYSAQWTVHVDPFQVKTARANKLGLWFWGLLGGFPLGSVNRFLWWRYWHRLSMVELAAAVAAWRWRSHFV
jgi:hypothetical protein